jgi:hypothetical protein
MIACAVWQISETSYCLAIHFENYPPTPGFMTSYAVFQKKLSQNACKIGRDAGSNVYKVE